MEGEQIKDLGRYLGCWCRYVYRGEEITHPFSTGVLYSVSWDSDYILFQLHLKPLSSLTQEDFERMYKELNNMGLPLHAYPVSRFLKGVYGMAWKYADWLRNNSYYLGEESIKEFVKLEE